ncbi:MAG: type II secretion system protein [Phycisphaerales bacterium]
MRQPRIRFAFTLIELLVVISISVCSCPRSGRRASTLVPARVCRT